MYLTPPTSPLVYPNKVLNRRVDGWWYGRLRDGSKGLFPSNYVTPISGQPEGRAAASRTTNPTREDGVSNLSELETERGLGPALHDAEYSADEGCGKQLVEAAGGRGEGLLSRERAPLTPPREAVRETESDKHPVQGLVTNRGSPDACSPHPVTSRGKAPATTPEVVEMALQTLHGSCPEVSDQETEQVERSSTPFTEMRPGGGGDLSGSPTEACMRASTSRSSCSPAGEVAAAAVAVSVGETKPDKRCDRAGADGRGGCQRHGFVACVLCDNDGLVGSRTVSSDGQSTVPVQPAEGRPAAFHLTALDRCGSSHSGNSGGGNNRGKGVSALPKSVTSLGPITNPLASADNHGLRHKDGQRQHTKPMTVTPGARDPECRPCERHLLLDCILCKMLPTVHGASSPQQVNFGRSASLPTLGGAIDGGRGHGRAGAPEMEATAAASVSSLFGSVRLGTAESACKQHNLPGCLLCISGAGTTQSSHDTAIGGRHRSPLLHPPLSHGDGFHALRLSPSRSFDNQPSRGDDWAAGASSIAADNGLLSFGFSRRTSKDPAKLFGKLQISPATTHSIREAFGVDAVSTLVDQTSPGAGREMAGDAGNHDGNNHNNDVDMSASLQEVGREGGNRGDTHNNGAEMPASLRHLRRRQTTAATARTGNHQDKGVRSTLRAISSRRRRLEDSSKRTDDAADAAMARSAAAYRGGRRHRHRGGGTPSRKRASKPLVGRRRQSGAQAGTVVSGTRAREGGGRGGDEDLAARAMTAALAVLR